MVKSTTRPWDMAQHLETEEDRGAYLEAGLEDGDPAVVAAMKRDIARAQSWEAFFADELLLLPEDFKTDDDAPPPEDLPG